MLCLTEDIVLWRILRDIYKLPSLVNSILHSTPTVTLLSRYLLLEALFNNQLNSG